MLNDGSYTRATCIYELENGNAASLHASQEAACKVESSAKEVVMKVMSLRAPDVPVPAVLKGAPPSRKPLRDGGWPKDRLEQFKAAFVELSSRLRGYSETMEI